MKTLVNFKVVDLEVPRSIRGGSTIFPTIAAKPARPRAPDLIRIACATSLAINPIAVYRGKSCRFGNGNVSLV